MEGYIFSYTVIYFICTQLIVTDILINNIWV